MNNPFIVVVEDDATIAELIEFNLHNDGYITRSFGDGAGMLKVLPDLPPVSLFVLDVMLPGMDGFEILKRLKQNPDTEEIPVLMLTARSTESDKVRGFTTGADDYLTKPFGIREFLARIEALIRRYQRLTSLKTANSEASGAAVSIDDARHRVFRDGEEVEMTHREYELLKFLLQNRGIAFSRDELLNAVWGYDYYGETRTVDVHIRQLRRKLELDDSNPALIETVRGRGYRFADRLPEQE